MNPDEVMDTDNPGFSDFENQGPVHDENSLSADSVGSADAASSLHAAAVNWENQAQEPINLEQHLQAPTTGDHAVPDRNSSFFLSFQKTVKQQQLKISALMKEKEVLSSNVEIARADLEIYKRWSAFQKEEIAELREEKSRWWGQDRERCPQCSFEFIHREQLPD